MFQCIMYHIVFTYLEILEEYLGSAALGAPFLESYALLMSMAVVTGVYGEANAAALLQARVIPLP